jgi:hypothetical protein
LEFHKEFRHSTANPFLIIAFATSQSGGRLLVAVGELSVPFALCGWSLAVLADVDWSFRVLGAVGGANGVQILFMWVLSKHFLRRFEGTSDFNTSLFEHVSARMLRERQFGTREGKGHDWNGVPLVFVPVS